VFTGIFTLLFYAKIGGEQAERQHFLVISGRETVKELRQG
jgi:hypothetical protein